MSAKVLREAAALMRERAEGAYGSPWQAIEAHVWTENDVDPEEGPTVYVNGGVYASQSNTAAHVASWHPDVALAVADWLDKEADWADVGAANSPDDEALAVARAYLGEV